MIRQVQIINSITKDNGTTIVCGKIISHGVVKTWFAEHFNDVWQVGPYEQDVLNQDDFDTITVHLNSVNLRKSA